MTNKQFLILATALSAAGLSGCSGSGSEPAPIENADGAAASAPIRERPAATVAAETASPAPDTEAPATNDTLADIPPEEAPAPDQQMLDDAAATGMTARASREGDPAADVTPAEQVEKK